MSRRPVNRRAATHSISLPPDLSAWAKAEADACQMPLSAWLALTLAVVRQNGHTTELRRRVAALEHRLGVAP